MTMSAVCEFPRAWTCAMEACTRVPWAQALWLTFTHTCLGLALGWCWECRNQHRCGVWSLGLC